MSSWRVVSGWSGIGFVALQVLAAVIYALGGLPLAIEDSAAQASYTARNASLFLAVAIVAWNLRAGARLNSPRDEATSLLLHRGRIFLAP